MGIERIQIATRGAFYGRAMDAKDTMTEHLRLVVFAELIAWREKHPKRSVSFMDAMGMTMIGVSGGANMDPYSVNDYTEYSEDDRHYRVFRDLISLMEWYIEMSTDLNIVVHDIVLGDPIWPIHMPRDKGHAHLVEGN